MQPVKSLKPEGVSRAFCVERDCRVAWLLRRLAKMEQSQLSCSYNVLLFLEWNKDSALSPVFLCSSIMYGLCWHYRWAYWGWILVTVLLTLNQTDICGSEWNIKFHFQQCLCVTSAVYAAKDYSNNMHSNNSSVADSPETPLLAPSAVQNAI